ncbi:DtxR family Mn-dependent transcriptional regulator [Rhodococcus sp. PvR044]|nr:DtxR family iron (metal) dependent repressor [Rhodococcus sp. OK611]SNX90653.1 iron (metal) dependent repressor, DtxR family [Rhodococcus sp. OK270]
MALRQSECNADSRTHAGRIGHRRRGVQVKDLVDTTEMYLRTIYDLEEEGVVPLRARIAERLEQSGPTVSQTVARMERDGLLLVAGDRHLELTDKGRGLAIAVMRKHRLAERLLVDVIGLDWDQVHAEACRWEHVMSEEVERRLVEVLNNPTTSPYGNPIPGLDELGLNRPADNGETLIRLTDVPPGQPTAVVVRRLAEHVQSDPEVIGRLREAGVVPDARVTVETKPGSVTITVPGHEGFDLSEEMAHAVQVKQV